MLKNYTEQELSTMDLDEVNELIYNYAQTLGVVNNEVGYYRIGVDHTGITIDIKDKANPDDYGSGMDMSLLNNTTIDFYEIAENALMTEDFHPVHEIVDKLHSLGFVYSIGMQER